MVEGRADQDTRLQRLEATVLALSEKVEALSARLEKLEPGA